MILLVHLLFGAAIGSVVKSIPIAILLAFLSHYLLDLFPHIEYPISNIEKKQWRKTIPDFSRVFLDFCLGFLLIAVFSNSSTSQEQLIIYICAFFAILPDGFTLLSKVAPIKILKIHNKFHEKIHFLKYEKISNFWRIFSQIVIVIISIILLTRQ